MSILYCNRTSPYSRRIRVLMRELGVDSQYDEVVVDPFASPAELVERNPLSKIPVLVTEDGMTLPDSALIAEYLCSVADAPTPLSTGDWHAVRRLALVTGIMDAAVQVVMESRRPESIRLPAHVDRHSAVITRAVDALELETLTAPDETPDLVTITTAVALAYLDFRMPWHRWRQQHNVLAEWLDAFAARDAMRDTAPPAT